MNTDLKARLNQGLGLWGLEVTEKQVEQLQVYLQLLQKWNKAYNLTAIKDLDSMLSLHLLDSLSIAPFLKGEKFLDAGTGAGLPGIPLAILYPERQFTLLDSNGKRIRFLFQVGQTLKLTNVDEVQARVEGFNPGAKYDGILSRAFASLAEMLDSCRHLLKPDGLFYAMKGKYPEAELSQLPKIYKVNAVIPLAVPGIDGERHLVELGFS